MKPVFIDVREPAEYERSHVKGALNIPPAALMAGAEALVDVPKDAPLVLYCISGARSRMSMQYLSAMGFTNVTNGINKQQVEAKYSICGDGASSEV